MTPFASVFQRMLWLVLVSFLSDYKTLPAFHPSEHTQVNEDEKKVHQRSSLCPEFVPPTVFTAMRKRPTLDFQSKTWYSPCLYAMCPYVCTARDFAPAFRSFLLVPVCVLQVILSLLYVPVTCPWVCTARDFASALRSCHLSLSVYCTWFCPCFTFLFTCPRVCTARDFTPAIRPCCLSLCVYCTWFCPCHTFLLPVPVCVPHEILLLTRIALTCPCNTSPRFSLSPRNPYDITYRFFGPF